MIVLILVVFFLGYETVGMCSKRYSAVGLRSVN